MLVLEFGDCLFEELLGGEGDARAIIAVNLAVTANLSVASIDKTAKLVRTEGLRLVNPIEVQEYRRIYAGQKVCIRQAELLHVAQGEFMEDLSDPQKSVPRRLRDAERFSITLFVYFSYGSPVVAQVEPQPPAPVCDTKRSAAMVTGSRPHLEVERLEVRRVRG